MITVELTPCVKDVSLEVFRQWGSPTFKLSGRDAQIESDIRFVFLIDLASLILSESELVKMLVLELPGPRVIWTISSALEMHALPEILYPLIHVKQ